MNLVEAVILGIVQGLAEFLPVSSSGHLVLFSKLFGITEGTLTFGIALHIATLIPVFVVFWDDIADLILHPFQKTTLLLIIATSPAVLAGLFLGDFIDQLFQGGLFLAVGFFITGVLLLAADSVIDGTKRLKHMSGLDALIIGLMQAVAICPAISRSGSTITGALLLKLDRRTASRFSFLMSIPVILGAAVLELKKLFTGDLPAGTFSIIPFAAGFITAAVCGFFAVTVMLKAIRESKLKIFSYYVFALSFLILFDSLFTKRFF